MSMIVLASGAALLHHAGMSLLATVALFVLVMATMCRRFVPEV
jgi:hypothetical protein